MPQAYGERHTETGTPFAIEEGVCYVVRGKSVDSTYRLASLQAEQGVPVLCVSRLYPVRLLSKYRLASATVWWITESPGEGHFDPTAVGTLASAIEVYADQHPEGCLIVLDGVEFIAIHLGFAKTLLFIEHLNEFVMPRRATLLLPVDPGCFDPKEFAQLDRFTGGIEEEELRDALDAYEVNRNLGGV